MKKIIFGILALTAGFFTSCSNDDIEIISQSDVTLNISTQNLYDTFGITESIKSRFLSSDNSYKIGIFSFIYDENGNLVATSESFEKTFGLVAEPFLLADGNYTAIVIETLVDANNQNQSDYLKIIGKEKLSTIEVAYKSDAIKKASWYSAVGIASQTFSASSSSVNVVPKAIGTILSSYFYNLNNSQHTWIGTLTKDAPSGRYCNPKLVGDARFHYSVYQAKNTWVTRFSKTTTSTFDSEESFAVYILEEGSYLTTVTATQPKEDGSITFTPYPNSNTKVNYVDGSIIYSGLYYTGVSGQECVASFLNTYSELVAWYQEQESKYQKTISIIKPVISWGSSVSSVQSAMKDYTLAAGSAGKAEYVDENHYALLYNGNGGAETAIIYRFTGQTTGLFESDCFYDPSKYSLSSLKAILDKAFTMVESKGDMYYYTSSDEKTGIVLLSNDEYNIIYWLDISVMESHSRKDMMMQKAKSISFSLPNK